jgi:cytochrome c-type biogenesis protein CcmH/NrfG
MTGGRRKQSDLLGTRPERGSAPRSEQRKRAGSRRAPPSLAPLSIPLLLLVLLLVACSVSPEERLRRANLALASGKVDEAIAELESGIAAAPGVAALHERRGLALVHRGGAGDLERAEAAYREALRLDPSNAAALAGFGQLLWNAGRKGEAREAWQRLLALPATDDPVAAMERAKIRILLVQDLRDRQAREAFADESTTPLGSGGAPSGE